MKRNVCKDIRLLKLQIYFINSTHIISDNSKSLLYIYSVYIYFSDCAYLLLILSVFGCLQPVRFQFFLSIISAAMLCPVLFCAALLLLTPLEITEARALHPSADTVQVLGEGWETRDKSG